MPYFSDIVKCLKQNLKVILKMNGLSSRNLNVGLRKFQMIIKKLCTYCMTERIFVGRFALTALDIHAKGQNIP